MVTKDEKDRCDLISYKIIGCAIEVHKTLGPGLLESVYEECLCFELSKQKIKFQRQLNIPIKYKDSDLEIGYRIDLLVEDLVLIELKAVEKVLPIHKAQLKTYLKLADKWLGLLMNFNVERIKDGIERIVWG